MLGVEQRRLNRGLFFMPTANGIPNGATDDVHMNFSAAHNDPYPHMVSFSHQPSQGHTLHAIQLGSTPALHVPPWRGGAQIHLAMTPVRSAAGNAIFTTDLP
ncbi:unnamed protein product [Caretta caretta]